jgi:hypothetical protein
MTLPTWSHCSPTLNRIDILEQAVRLSLQQTCLAEEIIIVDAGNQLDTNRARIEAVFAMTVRAEVARRKPFDESLLSCCPAEDLDASCRFSRQGMNVMVEAARVHHSEAAAGRIKRRQAITLSLINRAAFVVQKGARPACDIPAHYLLYLRRVVAEFLKDGLSRCFTFPQFLGAISAFGPTVTIFHHGRADFDDGYPARQMRVLRWPQTPYPASVPTAPLSPQNHKG